MKSSGARIDEDGNYVISPEDFALMWNELQQLEFDVKMKDAQIRSLEDLARRESARANSEASARARAELDVAEKTLIIKVVLVTSIVLIGGGITIGLVTK